MQEKKVDIGLPTAWDGRRLLFPFLWFYQNNICIIIICILCLSYH